jgi:hypothetical protein
VKGFAIDGVFKEPVQWVTGFAIDGVLKEPKYDYFEIWLWC